MKKILCIILALVMLLSFAACSDKKDTASDENVSASAQTSTTMSMEEIRAVNQNPEIVLSEATYVAMLSELTNNPNNYIGKIVQLEGMFTYQDFTDQGGSVYYYVYRDGTSPCPSCPANMCGLEFTTPDNQYPDYTPKNTDTNKDRPWIRVTGTFDQYFEDQNGKQVPFYTLRNATFEVLTTRGKESVKAQ